MRATIKDVAARAGVSTATVSKYVNGGNLREAYRVRVEKAVRELDFTISEIARNLKIHRSFTIGILVPTLGSTFITNTVTVVQHYLLENGYTTLIIDCQSDLDLEKRQVYMLLKRRVDGILLFPMDNEADVIDAIRTRDIPLVLLDNLVEGTPCNGVVTDSRKSAYELTRRLIDLAHQKIAICAGPEKFYTSRERLLGYRQAMAESGLTSIVLRGNYDIDSAYYAVKSLPDSACRPTALISTNYYMTIGALKALREIGWSIPDDISFASFDSLEELGCLINPSLTAVVQPMHKIGVAAAQKILRLIEGGESDDPEVEVVETSILYTESIRARQ